MTFFFLIVYFLIIAAVIEIHVILFQLTGLKKEISRFQVISMMTGTGFTTGESELILGHPVRRKLATFLILFGAFSLAVIISSISNILLDGLKTYEILYIAGSVLIVFVILKLRGVQRVLAGLFKQKMKQVVSVIDLPVRDIFLTHKEDYVLNLRIYQESSLFSSTVHQAVPEYEQLDFVILFIKRGDIKIRKNVYQTEFQEGDEVLLFGNKKVLMKRFKLDIRIMKNKLKEHVPTIINF